MEQLSDVIMLVTSQTLIGLWSLLTKLSSNSARLLTGKKGLLFVFSHVDFLTVAVNGFISIKSHIHLIRLHL